MAIFKSNGGRTLPIHCESGIISLLTPKDRFILSPETASAAQEIIEYLES